MKRYVISIIRNVRIITNILSIKTQFCLVIYRFLGYYFSNIILFYTNICKIYKYTSTWLWDI